MSELHNGSLMEAYMQKQATQTPAQSAPQTTNEQINNNVAPTPGAFENMGNQADTMYNQWINAYGAPTVNGLTGAGLGAAAGGLLGGGKGALGLGLLGGALGMAYGAIPGGTPTEKWDYVKKWVIDQFAKGMSEEDIKKGIQTMAGTQAAQDAGADMGRDFANKKLDQIKKDHPTLYGIGSWLGRRVGIGRKDIVEAAGGVGRDAVKTVGEPQQPAQQTAQQQPAAPTQAQQPAAPHQKNVEVQEGQLANAYWNKQQPAATAQPAPPQQQPKPAQPAPQPIQRPQQPTR